MIRSIKIHYMALVCIECLVDIFRHILCANEILNFLNLMLRYYSSWIQVCCKQFKGNRSSRCYNFRLCCPNIYVKHWGAFHGLCGPWGALTKLHGVHNWFQQQTWPTLWVMPVRVTIVLVFKLLANEILTLWCFICIRRLPHS